MDIMFVDSVHRVILCRNHSSQPTKDRIVSKDGYETK